MKRIKWHVLLAIVLLLAAMAAFFVKTYRANNGPGQDATPLDATLATSQMLALTLADAHGVAQPMRQWQGKILVVNLWATWCSPCRAEIPAFSRLQRKYADKGVQFVGITLDPADRVAEFSQQTASTYPFLIASHTLLPIATGLGNVTGSVPFTAIFTRDGRLYRAHTGIWKEAALDATLAELTR